MSFQTEPSATGYQIKKTQTQRDSTPLKIFNDLSAAGQFRFIVDHAKLQRFSRSTLCWPRIHLREKDKLRVYRGPLCLLKQAPRHDRSQGWALLSDSDVAYCQSFQGYSAALHRNGDFLVRYLHLLANSSIRIYFGLMTSARFGVERDVLDKADFDELPIIPMATLSTQKRDAIVELSRKLVAKENENVTQEDVIFTQIDSLFCDLYGLEPLDLEVIRDTLSVGLPYGACRSHACRSPSETEREVFRKRLEVVMRPFFKIADQELQVSLWKPDNPFLKSKSPFGVLFIGQQGDAKREPEAVFRDKVLPLANETGSTLIIHKLDGGLIVGILNQYRYWTPSRARLLGAEIVGEHMDVFEE
jgi:hypothetical protein